MRILLNKKINKKVLMQKKLWLHHRLPLGLYNLELGLITLCLTVKMKRIGRVVSEKVRKFLIPIP